MNRRTLNFWLIAVIGVAAFGWMVAELVRVFLEIRNASGVAAVPWDGVIQHKVGELMVGIPFVANLALSNVWPKERVLSLIRRTFIFMVIGGLLNAVAWYHLADRIGASDFLRIWCLIIFAFGLSGSWLLSLMVNRMTPIPESTKR